jgi:hypothetical protein
MLLPRGTTHEQARLGSNQEDGQPIRPEQQRGHQRHGADGKWNPEMAILWWDKL